MKSKLTLALIAILITGALASGVLWLLPKNAIPESDIEKRLKTPELIPQITWRMLNSFDYNTNIGPAELMALDGELVKIPGYVVSLSDSWSELDEFLLVPDGQACIHVPPPPPNLIVTVTLRQPASMDEVFNPSWVYGIFRIEDTYSVHGGSSYTLDGVKIEKFEYDGY